jgi:hypothetical protein
LFASEDHDAFGLFACFDAQMPFVAATNVIEDTCQPTRRRPISLGL